MEVKGMKQVIFYKRFFITLLLASSLFSSWAYAGCWVEDGTFYAQKKLDMTAFAIYMDEGKKADALRMVDDGRIKTCSQASAIVLRRDGPLVYAQIIGIGKVWIYKTFLHCQ
jgi:hypothetical protein